MDVSAKLTTLTRVGFAARGLLYLVIAFLVIGSGRSEDPSGALRYLAEGSGRLLLILMAAGFIAYGLWRLADAAFDIERHGSTGKALVERLGAGASGVVHMLFAWQAVRIIQGTGSTESGGTQQGAQTALTMPGGQLLLTLAGVALIGVGAFQLIKAIKGSFLKHLKPQVASNPAVKWAGKLGYAARGIIFLISGAFLLHAGLDAQAAEAGGTAEALAWLRKPWDQVIAVGLFFFGMFSLVEARYRILHDVPVERAVNGISGQRRR